MIMAGLKTDEAQDKAAQILERVELGHRMFKPPRGDVRRQQQRVGHRPRLRQRSGDHPGGRADGKPGPSDRQADSSRLLRTLNKEKGVTIISATHDHKMLAVSDRILWIRDGLVGPDSEARGAEDRGRRD
jgi:putative ABC transport system ATP-binding protein